MNAECWQRSGLSSNGSKDRGDGSPSPERDDGRSNTSPRSARQASDPKLVVATPDDSPSPKRDRRPRLLSRSRENAGTPASAGGQEDAPTPPLARVGREDTSKFDESFDETNKLDLSNHGGEQHAVLHAASPGVVIMAGPPLGDVTPVEMVTSEPGLDLAEVSGGGGAVPGGNGASQAT